ncbi:MAG TPA: hypothetical protein VEL07_05730 [Planctomycetota bacterium]|nr:hypothetical protein [Planctomycetota bacterium]
MTKPGMIATTARALGLSAALLGGLAAATVDVDYDQIRDLPLGQNLITELKIDIPGGPAEYAAELKRLRLDWTGTKSALLLAARGLPVPAMKTALAEATPMATPHGDAFPLPRDPRYALLPLADDEAVIGTAKGLGEQYTPSPWPEPTGAALAFNGVPGDINLAEFADRVNDFQMTLTREGMLIGTINCKDRKTARGLMSYISNRLPFLTLAASVGVDKAQFPKRMIDAAVIERNAHVITVTIDLTKDDALRKDAHEYLIKTLRRRMKKAA